MVIKMNPYFLFYYILMIICGLIGSYLYVKSCMPSIEEKKIGAFSYERCAKLRYYASMVLSLSFIYFFCYNFPQLRSGTSLDYFSWPYWISFIVSMAFLIPGIILFLKARKDLGTESDAPKKYHHVVSTGIYKLVRHPQLFAELLMWYFISFLMHAPILIITATVFWIPMYVIWCIFEEKDLINRYGDEYIEYKKHTKFLIPYIF